MSKEETVEVNIPKSMADFIRKQEWFKLYNDLEDFMMEAVRRQLERWMST